MTTTVIFKQEPNGHFIEHIARGENHYKPTINQIQTAFHILAPIILVQNEPKFISQFSNHQLMVKIRQIKEINETIKSELHIHKYK